jgi:hypothetical protein
MSRNGRSAGGVRTTTRLGTAALPADESGPGEVMRALLDSGHGGTGATEVLAQFLQPSAGEGRVACCLSQEATEPSQDDDALLQGC